MSWLKSIPFLAHLKRRDRDRLARYNIVIAILLAGWFPSIVMLVVSYSILNSTLESKILHDRQTFVQLIAHLVADDLSHTGSVIEYYQTQPDVAKMLAGPNASPAAQQWLTQTFYSHPRIDGMFITGVDGQLIASLPAIPPDATQDFSATLWREGAMGSPDVYISPVHPRLPDGRMATAIVGAVRTPERTVVGYLGVWVLVERMGRRLSTIDFDDKSICQVVDQTGKPLFTNNFAPKQDTASPQAAKIIEEIRKLKTGSIERDGNLYSFTNVNATGWMTIVEQPKAVAYQPEASYEEVKIAPGEAIERVLNFGAPYQLVEQPFTDREGMTRFVNVNLLRLQGSEQTIQGVLYLVEDKTRDVTLRQELIGANAAKDQFLALLSHELRNPLSPVIAMVGELEASAPDSPEVRRALEVIRRNVELEARLIDDLLDVTRISKGKLQLSLETASVHEILQRSYEICREDIAAKDLKIEFRLRAERAYVEGDPARLQQVFWNLIKNSVKFTPENGRIVIETLNPTPDTVEIRTTDTGIGIEADKMDRIFNAFEQGQSSITRRFGGLGLGLAISKAMVGAHGGTIKAESHGKNRGATFIVTLTTVAAPAMAAGIAQPKEPKAADSTRPQVKRAGPRVLVVDDHIDTCTGMKMMLERRGYRVTVAHTADQAMEKVRHAEFDLVISDIGLPDRSGYELMQELSTTRGLRGIALSGFGMENDVTRARAAGFSEHLTKPINFDRLDEAIQALLVEPEPAIQS
ncbi:MAG: response regulator [Verrucomicrobiaceae bacterium]|nr:response regulator [Verrucomicrobiaceae bacterium]